MSAEAATIPAAAAPVLGRRQVHAVAACYFVASFAALGLPPYLTSILPELGDRTAHWAGLLYIVPTVFGGLAAPLWGRLADRYGRKRLLLRAQLGLALSFLLAGAADSLPTFTAALVLQGILGGTFAATNGYLAAGLDGTRLSWALTLMQGSARAALVAAPIVVGSLSPWLSPHRQYALLALLPLGAAAMLLALPEPREAVVTAVGPPVESRPADGQPAERHQPAAGQRRLLRELYVFEFAFVFSTVISFPYLIALLGDRISGISPVVSGALFALPHLCYLLFAAPVHSAFRSRPRLGIALGFAAVAAGLAGHAVAGSLITFTAVRLLLGAGLTLGLVCLSLLAADAVQGRSPGRMFGSLEFVSKGGAVAAGVVAALGNSVVGPTAPVLAGTAVALITVAAAAHALFSHP
ncbi:MFS transporter [Streptomyces sp. H10-C2]|uniref:MFS transporter n=1 Tax=unclassified Streptomyces TaxID=2593676 RepID=UPI0024BBC1FF|nr:MULTISPECIES: MFS transporter [unclassified Streptomyces]MDJ0344633.1 MFS transporter [Streptomyces sp. PH10-H1]MDJ0373207.1 MFS transporter [Streptomyces sp. H10-C2]